VRDSQYHPNVPDTVRDTYRPTRTITTREGWVKLVACDEPGGPWLVRGADGDPYLWLGADGRVCDVGTRYAGRPADVLLSILLEGCAARDEYPVIRLRDNQVSARARELLGRRVARLVKAGILAAAPEPMPEAPPPSPAPDPPRAAAPRRRPVRRASVEPELTPMRQVALFGARRA